MSVPIVDLRSDTVTRPTLAMRRAMADAEVGDDVYGEDPTINKLQDRAAEMFECEAGLFVPSGSMGNQTAIKVHTHHGQEVICEQRAHIYNSEMAMTAAFSGCLARTVYAEDGILSWDLISPLLRSRNDRRACTGLISLENSSNFAGGSVYPLQVSNEICHQAHKAGLPVHLDGARVFNAALATGATVAELTRNFDSVMFCLSKALGAPVGSMLVGSKEFISEARLVRRMLGGGMRQAGVLAAAGLVALEESPKRLHDDHENAKLLAQGLAQIVGIKINPEKVVTNILFFDVSESRLSSSEVSDQLRVRRILANPSTPSLIRMVTHYDVDRTACERTLLALQRIFAPSNKHSVT